MKDYLEMRQFAAEIYLFNSFETHPLISKEHCFVFCSSNDRKVDLCFLPRHPLRDKSTVNLSPSSFMRTQNQMCQPMTQKTFSPHDAKVTSEEAVTGWKKMIWSKRRGVGGSGWEGWDKDEEKRWVGAGVKRLMLWHHMGSYILREWSPLHFTSKQEAVRTSESLRRRTRRKRSSSITLNFSPASSVASEPLTLWTKTRPQVNFSVQKPFTSHGSPLSSGCRHSWLVWFFSVSHAAHFAQVSNRHLSTGSLLLFIIWFIGHEKNNNLSFLPFNL